MSVETHGRSPQQQGPARRRILHVLGPSLAIAWFFIIGPLQLKEPLAWSLHTPLEACGEDEISLLLKRYSTIREDLAATSRVGYLTDVTTIRKARYVQYLDEHVLGRALAPTIVVSSAEEELVVANFASPVEGLANARRRGLTVLRDYGDGLYLLRRKP